MEKFGELDVDSIRIVLRHSFIEIESTVQGVQRDNFAVIRNDKVWNIAVDSYKLTYHIPPAQRTPSIPGGEKLKDSHGFCPCMISSKIS